jgi:hypothetical protein
MFDRGLVMLEEPLQNYDLCRRAESTAKTQWLRSTTLVYSLYYSMNQKVGEWLCMTWRRFSHLAYFFGQERFSTRSFSNWLTRRTWRLFFQEEDGIGLVMYSVEKLPTSPKLLSDGHQRVNFENNL